MKSYRLNRKAKGFGLLEVILVFAIVIGAAAVVFTVFQSAKPSADASNEGSNVSTIATNLKSTFGIANKYTGLDLPTAIKAKAIPASMVSGNTANSSWGSIDTTVSARTTAGCAGTDRCFDITYNSVPADACAKLVSGVSGFFPDGITVAGSDVLDATTHAVIPATLADKCSTDGVAIVFTGK